MTRKITLKNNLKNSPVQDRLNAQSLVIDPNLTAALLADAAELNQFNNTVLSNKALTALQGKQPGDEDQALLTNDDQAPIAAPVLLADAGGAAGGGTVVSDAGGGAGPGNGAAGVGASNAGAGAVGAAGAAATFSALPALGLLALGAAGGGGGGSSGPRDFLDVGVLDLTNATDSGTKHDLRTNDNHPSVQFKGEANLTLVVYGPNDVLLSPTQYTVAYDANSGTYTVTLTDSTAGTGGSTDPFGDYVRYQPQGTVNYQTYNPVNTADGIYRVVATDTGGNTGEVGHFEIDTTASITLGAISGGYVNLAETTSGVVIGGTISDVDSGQVVTVTLNDGVHTATYYGTVSGGNWTATIPKSYFDALSQAGTTHITASATVTDLTGNVTSATGGTGQTFDFNPLVPAVAINSPSSLFGDGYVNASEDDDGDLLPISGTTVNVANGTQLTVTLTDGTHTYHYVTTVDIHGAWSINVPPSEMRLMNQGAIQVSADIPSNYPNYSALATPATAGFVYDTIAPVIQITDLHSAADGFLNNAEDEQTLAISGTTTAEEGQTVTVTITDGNPSHTIVLTTLVHAGNVWEISLTPAQLKGLNQGSITVDASVYDKAGNGPGTDTDAYIYDSVAPATPSITGFTDDTQTLNFKTEVPNDLFASPQYTGNLLVNNGYKDGNSANGKLWINDASPTVTVNYGASFESYTGASKTVALDVMVYDKSGTTLLGTYQLHSDALTSGSSCDFDLASLHLADGSYHLVMNASTTDAAGNTSALATSTVDFSLDTHAPDAPAITDLSTYDPPSKVFLGPTTVAITGTYTDAPANSDSESPVTNIIATFGYLANGSSITPTLSAPNPASIGDGQWQLVYDAKDLNDQVGIYSITTAAVDEAGNISQNSEAVNVVLGTTQGNDTIIVKDLVDEVNTFVNAWNLSHAPSEQRDVLEYGSLVFGFSGNDSIVGYTGDDVIYGGAGKDTIYGGAGNDKLVGGDSDGSDPNEPDQNDMLYGEAGNDLLMGGKQNDVLDGGSGNDTLYGELGADTMTGGTGSDQFVFNTSVDVDHITDFSHAEGDKIVLARTVFAGLTTGAMLSGDYSSHITYNAATGAVAFDNTVFVYLDNKPVSLSNTDFMVIA
ncbi:MAG: hypothetical protein ACKOXU_05185 [Limnohabitans sp.]